MKYDIIHALQSLKPGAQWIHNGSDYSGLEWLDSSQTKPCLLYTSDAADE